MKLLLENWRGYLEKLKEQQTPNKRKKLYDDYYITYDIGGADSVDSRSTQKVGYQVCDSEDKIGGENIGVGVVELYTAEGNQVMSFIIHKYRGWIGDISQIRDCSDEDDDYAYDDDDDYAYDDDDDYAYDDDDDDDVYCKRCVSGLIRRRIITDDFEDEDLYSGHWFVDDNELHMSGISDLAAAKLGIALRESVLAILKEKLNAEYYVMADATHQGHSNEAAQKIVKRLVKSDALHPEIKEYSPDTWIDEESENKFKIYQISNPTNKFRIKES